MALLTWVPSPIVAVAHNNRISYNNTLFNAHIRTDDGIMYLSVDFSALADNTAVDDSVPGNITADGLISPFGIDLPELLI